MTQPTSKEKANPHAQWLRELAGHMRSDHNWSHANTCEGAAREIDALAKHRDELLAAHEGSAHEPPVDQWQPIDTAPKDGTPVLVCNSERGGAWIAYYVSVYPSGYKPEDPWSSLMLNMRWHDTKWASTVPTHWQPIPPAYSRSTKGESL